AWTQADLPSAAAQPVTLTLVTVPADEKLTFARETSSAPATHALALPITALTADCPAPCEGASGTFWLFGRPAAGCGVSAPGWSGFAPSAPTGRAHSLF